MSVPIRFTQSVSLSGTNSYAWNDPSNWIGGTLPVPGDQLVINQPAGSTGVSYDNYQLAGPVLNFTLPDQSPSPVLEIASGITLIAAGAIFNSGTVIVDPGAVLATGPTGRVASNDLMEVGGTVSLPNFLNTGTFDYTSSSADIYLWAAKAVWNDIATNTVENFGVGDGLFLHAYVLTNSFPTYTAILSGTTLDVDGVSNSGVSTLLYELPHFSVAAGVTGLDATVVTAIDPSSGKAELFLDISAVCFVAGTRIATQRGEIAVEELREDDLVLTVSGDLRPIRWIGERRLDLTTHRRPESLFPIRIRRGAFAENVPQRDLMVSPDHCLFVDGELIPAKLLVNGMTITQDKAVRAVHYYHIELDNHDVLLAEGLPAESYIDTGNRGFFANTDGPLTLHPELEIDPERVHWQDRLCAPLRLRSAEIEPAWQRLAARADSLGYRRPSPAVTRDPDLRLVARGREFRPIAVEGDRYVFLLPADASDIRIASRAGMPVVANRRADDWRRLGVAVDRIGIRVGDERIDVPADHPALTEGWHPVERDAGGLRRWTDGNAALPLGLSAQDGAAMVEIHLAGTTPYALEEETVASLVA
jgi:Hint domain